MSIFGTVPSQPYVPQIPPINASGDPNKTQVDWTKVKKPDFEAVMNILSKVKRIYEDDDWVIDLIDGKVRVSYFEDCHYVDEIVLSKEYFEKAGD